MTDGSELRLFVAIELEEAVLRALGDLQGELRGRGLDWLRWTRSEGIHLTLKFLGETPRDRVSAITGAVERAATGHKKHGLALGRMGTFGSQRSPRVLWVDLTGDLEELRALQASVDEALASIGFPKEERRFSPHLTLARVPPEKAGEVVESLAAAVESVRVPTAEVRVDEVSLMQSTLGRGGAVYDRLARVGLDD